MDSILVLNIRPEPQAQRFAAAMEAAFGAGVEMLHSPLMQLEYLPFTLPEADFAAVIFTSESGVRAAVATGLSPLPRLALCVGPRTAEVARDFGFVAEAAGGDAQSLTRMIAARPETGPEAAPLLYLHGEDRAADIAAALGPSGQRVVSLVVYRQRALAASAEAMALVASGRPVVLPLFSPRSARLFLQAFAGQGAGAVLPVAISEVLPVAISENARRILPEPLAARAVVSARPDAEAMIEAIAAVISAAQRKGMNPGSP